jgi:thymidine kinase
MKLHLVVGPMFAGKTTYLINKTNELLASGVNKEEILLINHSSDSRYDNNSIICSHDKVKIDSKSMSTILPIVNLPEYNWNIVNYIFIDEAQFFEDLYETITTKFMNKSNYSNINIFVFGLDGDYQQKPFQKSQLLELIPYCTSITKLLAKCTICNKQAPFTKRITNSSEQILVGGSNTYQPVCLQHL